MNISTIRIFILMSNVYAHKIKFVIHDAKIVSNVYIYCEVENVT